MGYQYKKITKYTNIFITISMLNLHISSKPKIINVKFKGTI